MELPVKSNECYKCVKRVTSRQQAFELRVRRLMSLGSSHLRYALHILPVPGDQSHDSQRQSIQLDLRSVHRGEAGISDGKHATGRVSVCNSKTGMCNVDGVIVDCVTVEMTAPLFDMPSQNVI